MAALQFDIAWRDPAANWRRIGDLLAAATVKPGDYVLLPELSDTGFTMDPPPADRPDPVASAALVARRHGIWIQCGHAEVPPGGGRMRNAATIVRPDGSVAATYRKVHLFSPGGEDRHYAPGDRIAVVDVPTPTGTWRVAPFICYDLRFPELFRLAALAGAEVFAIGACWPAPRALHRRALAVARALASAVPPPDREPGMGGRLQPYRTRARRRVRGRLVRRRAERRGRRGGGGRRAAPLRRA